MTQLPTELPTRLQNSATIRRAYPTILSLEQAAHNHVDSRRLIYARILGYLLLEGPSDQARTTVASEVISRQQNEDDVTAIGKAYYDHYIRAFKMNKGDTPESSSHPSRQSLETKTMENTLVDDPKDHADAKAKALKRDGFRCVITGAYDNTSLEHEPELKMIPQADNAWATITRCTHIFGESTNSGISGDNMGGAKHQYAAPVWAVMRHFGYTKIPAELDGARIHRLENVFTLESGAHGLFDQLHLWLEPTDVPGTYTLQASNPTYIAPHFRRTVVFTTPDRDKYPPPSPDYLAIHAACARVAHLSGAGRPFCRGAGTCAHAADSRS
ncbi:hypothetical protein Hypma_012344 [Hypsizygus marmoreus]|uniref:HNH nuclease domain-containing protein n=1 Tax=Hypsizygus marmoreus TaxID=39966 RepID=A0A369KBA4_HYPMA|nr:hypothetical protein Hypma_012344 [Hypsizygus marmoreus]